ncbi:enoyl-CoA hydratase/isomerase family protein [Chloroflexota bacterium]
MIVNYEKEGRIAIITINRPEAMNALSRQVMQMFHEIIIDFRDDPETWVGIITGAGDKAFCAGADLKEKQTNDDGTPMELPDTPMRGLELWKPLIAAINGWALGGGLEIALACDIRIASENARLGVPEITVGLIPGLGATQRLTRMIPWCKAAELLLMGKPVDAQEAYRICLINKIVPPDQLMSTAKEWAEIICQAAPLAVRAAKEAMIQGHSMTLEQGLLTEKALLDSIRGTKDYSEGRVAFSEKRKPIYKAE